jgi:hypothetical protein
MNNPTSSSWFDIVELPFVCWLNTIVVNGKESSIVEEIFDKSSNCIVRLVNKIWLSQCPWYNNGSVFKLNFEYLCKSYGIKHKPTTIKNPQANEILECIHQVLVQMSRNAEFDMAQLATPDDVDVLLDNAACWAALPIIWSLKPLQAQQYSDTTCSCRLRSPSWMAWERIEVEVRSRVSTLLYVYTNTPPQSAP